MQLIFSNINPQMQGKISDLIDIACEEILEDIPEETAASFNFVSTTEIAQLNKNYRDKDAPTNVLSFENHENGLLGDVIICEEVVEQEAKEQEKHMSITCCISRCTGFCTCWVMNMT